MRKKIAKLSLRKESLALLTDPQLVRGGQVIDTSRTNTFKPTDGPNCVDKSVSVCQTNCGCRFTN